MILLVAAVALLEGTPPTPPLAPGGIATVGTPGVTTSPTVPGPDDDKVVCRMEQETGSLMITHKICHTQGQWNQIARDSQDMTNTITRNGNHSHFGGGG